MLLQGHCKLDAFSLSSGSASGSLLPPVKSYLTRPVQRVAAGGRPAGRSGVKSKGRVVMDILLRNFFIEMGALR
ncbi:MAG: hypothetical protein H6R21_965, partial [Proteobacteria bacterium]|nr:hypothetical protein [Pseudomonadota bacterium]